MEVLFEPINNYAWDKSNITIPNILIKRIFDTFNLFNFTIEESEPLDTDVAIDPEVLGKVFERLLSVVEQKESGSFRTPKEIVKYMSQQGLIDYLNVKF